MTDVIGFGPLELAMSFFRIDEEGTSWLRGLRCEVWKASTSLRLESMKKDPLRCAVRDVRCGRLPLRCV